VTVPFTTHAETDTFGAMRKEDISAGGLRVSGFRSSASTGQGALSLRGYLGEDAITTTATTSQGIVNIRCSITDGGTGDGLVNTGGNLLAILDYSQCRALFNQDGDLYLDTEVNINDWDEYNDAELVRAGRLMMRSDDNPIKKQFMGIVNKYSDDLVKWKLINLNKDDPTHFMMGMKKWVMLNADCNWQNYERNLETRAIVDNLVEKISQKLGIPKMELLALGS